MRCEIRARRTSHGTEFEGFAFADRPISGSYRLVISQNGANSTDIEQSGEFDAAPGEAVSLGVAEVSGGRLHARLTIEDEFGGHCSDEFHS